MPGSSSAQPAQRPIATAEETRFRALVEAAHEGVWTVDTVGRTTYVNPRACALLGYAAHEMVGRPLFEFMDPGSAFLARTLFARPQRGIAETHEIPFRHRAGHEIATLMSIGPLMDEDGWFSGALVMVVDVTEQKRAETAVRRSEERFRSLIENSLDAIAVIDREGTLLYSSPGHARSLGYAPGELVGTSVFDLVHADDRAASVAVLGRVLRRAGETERLEVRGTHRDGTTITYDVVVRNLLHDPAVEGIVLNARDITAERALQAAARESDERYRTLFNANPLPVWVCDAETLELLAVNDAALEHYGYTREEFLGMTLLDLRPPEHAQDVLQEQVHFGDPERRHTSARLHVTKDGRRLQVEVTHAPAGPAEAFGGRVARLAVIHDVTERLEIEAQLRQAQKMEAIGQLAGGIAHDFNNLLTVLQLNTECLRQGGALGPDERESVEEIGSAVARAAALTRKLLAFSRREPLALRPVALDATIAGLATLLQRLIGHEIVVRIEGGAPGARVLADPGQLEQLLVNLSVNARDAMSGAGTLTIGTALVEAPSQDWATGVQDVQDVQDVLLTVADTGCGMDEATRAHIFEPFFTTKPAGEGTGLGLATVYAIVKQCGGAIEVETASGAGTTFRIRFPRVDA